jgi:hypothetical protein
MTATVAPAAPPAPRRDGGAKAPLRGRVELSVRRRAGRYRLAFLVFVLLLPLLLTSLLGGR